MCVRIINNPKLITYLEQFLENNVWINYIA